MPTNLSESGSDGRVREGEVMDRHRKKLIWNDNVAQGRRLQARSKVVICTESIAPVAAEGKEGAGKKAGGA